MAWEAASSTLDWLVRRFAFSLAIAAVPFSIAVPMTNALRLLSTVSSGPLPPPPPPHAGHIKDPPDRRMIEIIPSGIVCDATH